jgi:hypothetical protein
MTTARTFKLGRLPRGHDPNVPHLTALLAGQPQPPPPPSVDYTAGMPEAPNKFGPMLNDTLGDCTCAAYYHARQVWTFHTTGRTETARSGAVKLLYEKACGYDPRRSGEGPGGQVQHVLSYIHKNGAPLSVAGTKVDRILGYVEVDHRRVADVKRTIYDAGVAYVGLNMPQHVLPDDGEPPAIWDVVARDRIVGGHCVVLPGYDKDGLVVISWGQIYTMTWAFFAKYVDEVYSIADAAWTTSHLANGARLSLPPGFSR